MAQTLQKLNDLYGDTQTCAQLVGLDYIIDGSKGLTRLKQGKGFSYRDAANKAVNEEIKRRISELVIPPAWQAVWICPSDKGHILATGVDERGRKQYIYHPKWHTMRDLIKFYRMITFASALPAIRRDIDNNLTRKELSRDKVLAAMLWILDNAYIRVGNDAYFTENESVGLATLTDKHVVLAGPVITLNFKGKSNKDQQITLEHPKVAEIIKELKEVRGPRLFRYQAGSHWRDITADDINAYLHELTGLPISAKDFRTWGGTLMAFIHLIEEDEKGRKQARKPEKAVVQAVDQAAAVLGNTRAVARSSYIHPHLLSTYAHKDFGKHYSKAAKQRKLPGLDIHESELFHFLEKLFKTEFDLLKS